MAPVDLVGYCRHRPPAGARGHDSVTGPMTGAAPALGAPTEELPAEAWAVALVGLPGMGPARLLAMLREWAPEEAWARVVDGGWADSTAVAATVGPAVEALRRRWASAAAATSVSSLWGDHRGAGVGVAALGSSAYPAALVEDPEPPGVLFSAGEPAVIAGPRAAIVGTRSATRYGLDVAHQLGLELSSAGVSVVSGLALGIDGAAHAGALAADGAPPIGVVGCGLDVVYPRGHGPLWQAVRRRGVLLSEAPLGAPPVKWRFPARNRLLAALSDVVVVVESARTGGSMHTVTEATRRSRTVLAVPGPVSSSASEGTNRLIGEGAVPACDAGDVLVAIGLSAALRRPAGESRPAPDVEGGTVLDAMAWQPCSLDQIAVRTGLPLVGLSGVLARLEADGWVAVRGGWYERVTRPGP
ncbi:MAG: DNA-processing protein DprA [Acidimicrobiia bacterium]